MKRFLCLMLCALALFAPPLFADLPEEVSQTLDRLISRRGASATGTSQEVGIFAVGIGRSDLSKGKEIAYEVARLEAVRSVAALLGERVSSVKERHNLSLEATGEDPVVADFFRSRSEESLQSFLQGLQVLRAEVNAHGEMVVWVAVYEKSTDEAIALAALPIDLENNGTVRAIGMATDRKRAELHALRTAVEQVAGTMVVEFVTNNEANALRKRVGTAIDGLVESYRVLDVSCDNGVYTVEVIARVSKKKLYDSYRAYFKALDDPTFAISANTPELVRAFKQYFVKKGTPIADTPDEANYLIRLNGTFTERPNPVTGDIGTMLSLSMEVVSTDGSKVLLSLQPRRFAKDSSVLTKAQRHEIVAERACRNLKDALDQAFHDMVIRMLDDAL